jgi:tetratricopeptide (TPR) repeat protein
MMDELRLLVKQAEALASEGNWGDEAIGVNTRILELDDRLAGVYTRLARCFREQGNWLAACSMYQQVLVFDSTNRIATNQLANLEERLKDLEGIELIAEINDYREALSIGVAARRQGNAVLAIAALNHAVVLDPTLYALTALGAAYRLNRQLTEAESTYRRAIEMQDSAAARIGLAAVYTDQHRLRDAHSLYWRVLRDDGHNVYALNGLGAVLVKRGRLEQAECCFIRSATIGQASDDSIARLTDLRVAYIRRGDAAGEKRVQTILARLGRLGRPTGC